MKRGRGGKSLFPILADGEVVIADALQRHTACSRPHSTHTETVGILQNHGGCVLETRRRTSFLGMKVQG